MKSLLVSFIFFHFCFFAQSQNQSKQWYFGFGCGLDFNTEPPTALLDNAINTPEGCASIADKNGELLFYTNGVVVMNKNHQLMQNGNNLHGGESTTQAAIIVPYPLNDQLYFIFTIGAQLSRGLEYSIVDISKNDGLGAVTEKNIALLNYVSEKQTVIPHENGRDYWLITHLFETNEYHSFLISCDGVNEDAVVSRVGTAILENVACCETSSALGCMKASPNGKMIATTWTAIYDLVDTWPKSIWHLELTEFDNNTGTVSEERAVTQDFNPGLNLSYGVCFSPDNTKLYQSGREIGILPGYVINQYDLLSENISASQDRIAQDNIAYGTIEIGPNGKLYAARLNGITSLTTIENPNELNPEISSIDLNGKVSTWGLPNLIYDYKSEIFSEPLFVYDTMVCSSDVLFLDATLENGLSYYWNDGVINPQRNIKTPGLYYVDIETENCGSQRDSIYIEFSYTACKDDSYCDLIELAPNPFFDDINLSEDFEIVLFDASGKKVFNGFKSQYSFTDLASGMYFLQIGNCKSIKKIIKLY